MGRNKLIEHISKFAPFRDKEIELIKSSVYEKDFQANEIFLDKGQTETEMAFVVSGLFRFYYYDDKGNEVISSLIPENNFVTILSEYTGISVSPVIIQTVTESKTLIINRDSWNFFISKIPSWNIAMQKIGTQYYLEKTDFQRNIIKMSAEESYKYFARKYPTILNRIPLSYVANYLGITPFSLSRIRKKINSDKS